MTEKELSKLLNDTQNEISKYEFFYEVELKIENNMVKKRYKFLELLHNRGYST